MRERGTFYPLDPIQYDPMLGGVKRVGVHHVITIPLSLGKLPKQQLCWVCMVHPRNQLSSWAQELWATSGIMQFVLHLSEWFLSELEDGGGGFRAGGHSYASGYLRSF